MEAGDRPQAYYRFLTATQLNPENEQLWTWRGEMTDDPAEAAECFERVMEINPENHAAREQLVFLRLNKLQEGVRFSKEAHPSGKSISASPLNFRTLVIGLGVFFLVLSVLAVIIIAIIAKMLSTSAQVPQPDNAAVAEAAFSLPPTWTPQPTSTPLPGFTPVVRPSWKISKDATVRIGPGTAYDKAGILPNGSQIYIVARSKDSKFVQIEYSNDAGVAWIPSDSVLIGSDELAGLAVATSVPALPTVPKSAVVAPTAKPTFTPLPAFEFMPASTPRTTADCNRQTGVSGMVYSNLASLTPVNGVTVRITAFGQLQNTVSTGMKGRAGYWEWYFTNNADVVGDITLINGDGSPRSPSINFHLTSCYGSNPGNQFVVDFASTR